MSKFGKAGTRTVHASEAGGIINVTAGQSLMCTLDVKGGPALFVFACTHSEQFTPSGPVKDRYQWTIFDEPGSRATNGDEHVLTLQFSAGAKHYRLRMEIFDDNFALVKTLKDIEYESSEPTDFFVEPVLLGVK